MGVGVCAAACLLERVICGVTAKKIFVTDVTDDGLVAVNVGGDGADHTE